MTITLTESVIRKIQMTKILYDLAQSHIRSNSNPELTGVGVILLQDAVEIFANAVCEHISACPPNRDFDKLFDAIHKKTGKEIPYKTQMMALNQQRISAKHYCQLPVPADCQKYPVQVEQFFEQVSRDFLSVEFAVISLVNLIVDSRLRDFLSQAEIDLASDRYRECQINCRRALYFEFEKQFDTKTYEAYFGDVDFKSDNLRAQAANNILCEEKKCVSEHVCEPVDYIKIDQERIQRRLWVNEITSLDFWNLFRLTPKLYYYEREDEWVIKDEFKDEHYTKENAGYCFRKTIDVLLIIQRNRAKLKGLGLNMKLVKTNKPNVKVFCKATEKSGVVAVMPESSTEFRCFSRTRGLDSKDNYCYVFSSRAEPYLNGYIKENDLDYST